MRSEKGTGLAIAAALALIAAPAPAQTACAARAKMVATLEARYGEVPRLTALTGSELLEFFAAPSGSWTLLITTADGLSCLVAAGELFETIAPGDPA